MALDDLGRWNKRQAATQRRKELRDRAIAHLGGVCRICSYAGCPEAFDFHHLDPMGKDFNISAATSWERALPELAKCVLLCANCHREVHAGLHPDYLIDSYDHHGGQYEMSWDEEVESLDS